MVTLLDKQLSQSSLVDALYAFIEHGLDVVKRRTEYDADKVNHRIMILEVMGRYAGWIALESAIAGGADICLIPEVPYDINIAAQKVEERKKQGKKLK